MRFGEFCSSNGKIVFEQFSLEHNNKGEEMNRLPDLSSWISDLLQSALFAAIGIAIGVGQLLASSEILTWRIIIGRAISTAGIATASGATMIWFPNLPLAAQIGIAAAMASLGTSGLEKIFQRVLDRK